MPAYYNEIDGYAAQWLRNLAAAGHIAAGDVDERSIVDVRPGDLAGYEQCHFFAGIGGWPYALRLAGWPDDRGVWTGSCPCQPLSSAGQRKGHADERHFWPAFYRLIAERRPATVFGEQVAGALGREWLAGVRADLEAGGYAVGAANLCAASIDAPHIRQRLFWVADTNWHSGERRERRSMVRAEVAGIRDSARQRHRLRQPAHHRANGGLSAWVGGGRGHNGELSSDGDAPCGPDAGNSRWMGDTSSAGLSPSELALLPGSNWHDEGRATGEPSRSFWTDAEWLACLDGKARRTQPGIYPLAHGFPGRVGKLRAAGNAIVPQVAAKFVTAFMECRP